MRMCALAECECEDPCCLTSLRHYLDLQQIRHQSQARQLNAIEQSFSEWQLEGDMLDEAQADVYKEEWLTLKVAWICCKVIGKFISKKNV